MQSSKICTRCQILKDSSEFYARKTTKSGLRSDCKTCVAEQNRSYKSKNAERIKIYSAKYRKKNQEKRSAARREWYQENRDHAIQYAKDYVAKRLQENPDYVRNRNRAWVEANREKTRLKAHLRRRAKYDSGAFRVTEKELTKLRSMSCTYCGSEEDIQVDHVIPLARGGAHAIGNLVPACRKCNHSKNAKLLMEWRRDKSKGVFNGTN